MAQISLRHVSKRMGQVLAVNDFSLEIAQGELMAFVGPSGCGKTTTLRMVAGLADSSAGAIFFDERNVTHVPSHRRNTGMVFQGYALFPHMTVEQNVAFGLQMRGVSARDAKRRVGEALELVQLGSFATRLPRMLSGGQQQRVALARAVVIRPDVLLLDEPLSALDAKLRQEVRDEIRRLQKSLSLTTIFVTHDQEEAVSIADRIVVMNAGRVEQVGAAQEVYERPATRFVAQFIGASNFIQGQVEGPGRFRTRGGDLLAYAPGAGGSVADSLVVRPEKMELGGVPDAGTESNRLACVIDSVTYRGPLTEFAVRLPGGELLVVHRQNRTPGEARRLRPGESTTVSWPAEAGFVL